MKIKPILLALAAMCALGAHCAPWHWTAPVSGIISTETGGHPTAYLWIDENVDSVQALIFAFQNMNEETLFCSPSFREAMARERIAVLWFAPGFGQEWDIMQGVQEAFDGALDSLAARSSHPELASVPLIPFGHSAQATMPWNFTAWNPSRVLCLVSYHGDSPRTNLCGYGRANVEWGRNRNIDGIPALMVMGEYEWWDARLRPAVGFQIWYPHSCISFLGDAGRGHFDLGADTEAYIVRFIQKSLQARLSDGKLTEVDPADGRRLEIPFWSEITVDGHRPTFWYFDDEMLQWTRRRYEETRGKEACYVNFIGPDGRLLTYNPQAHCKVSARVIPDTDGNFELSAVFCDSTRTTVDERRDPSEIEIKYVSGPAEQTGHNRFKVDPTHPTWDNPRRRAKVTLVAEAPATATSKSAIQEIEITVE